LGDQRPASGVCRMGWLPRRPKHARRGRQQTEPDPAILLPGKVPWKIRRPEQISGQEPAPPRPSAIVTEAGRARSPSGEPTSPIIWCGGPPAKRCRSVELAGALMKASSSFARTYRRVARSPENPFPPKGYRGRVPARLMAGDPPTPQPLRTIRPACRHQTDADLHRRQRVTCFRTRSWSLLPAGGAVLHPRGLRARSVQTQYALPRQGGFGADPERPRVGSAAAPMRASGFRRDSGAGARMLKSAHADVQRAIAVSVEAGKGLPSGMRTNPRRTAPGAPAVASSAGMGALRAWDSLKRGFPPFCRLAPPSVRHGNLALPCPTDTHGSVAMITTPKGDIARKGQGSGARHPHRLRAWDRCRRPSPMIARPRANFPIRTR
jgi:hypothetical protein